VPHEPAVPTVTGKLIEGIAQFAAGLKGVDKIGDLFQAAGKAGDIAAAGRRGIAALKNIGKGTAADVLAFDHHEARLSNVLAQLPVPVARQVGQFLEARPDDGFAEGKAKQAIEGAGLGAAGEALFQGVRLLKKGLAAKAEMAAEGSTADELLDLPMEEKAGVGLTGQEFNFLGDPGNRQYFLRRDPSNAIRGARKVAAAGKETAAIGAEEIAPAAEEGLPAFAEIGPGHKDIPRLYDDALAAPAENRRITIGVVGKKAADWINAKLAGSSRARPVDVSGYEHTVDTDAIRHILKKHGEGFEKNPDNLPLTREDFNRIPEIISSPESIKLHPGPEGKPPSITYQKTAEDGSTYVVQAVQTAKKRLALKTMYKEKAGRASMSSAADPETLRPERAPSDNIANEGGNGKAAEDGERNYEINFARIDGPDDIKALMDQMVNRPELMPGIEISRRGVRSNEATLRAARDIDGFDSLMGRRSGDPFNAEQVVAARKVYYDATDKLMEAAKRAAGPQASAIDQFNFRKMVAIHQAVQKEFMGVRAEAGRALQAWRIPVGGSGPEKARALEELLTEFGGADASKDLAQRLAAVGDLNTSQINAIVNKAALARTVDAVAEAWTLGLLTNPQTHVVNLASNVLTALTLGGERLAAAAVKDSPVTLREGAEFFTAMIQSQKLALKNMAQAFRTGESGFGVGKVDLPRTRATARDILDPDGRASIFSKALDGWGSILDRYVGRSLAAGDEYSKTILYQAQLRALATRQGISRGLAGEALQKHIADTLAEPPATLRADAASFAQYGTFTRELDKGGQALQKMIAQQPLLRFVVPFVRTPGNIFKFAFERTPLAPLSSRVRSDIMAGGVRRATALARIGAGSSIMAIGADMALNGVITGSGPSDPDLRAALRRTGWQPYSVRIGDSWYSYARFEPVATMLGMAADVSEILSNYEAYDIPAQEEADQLVYAAALAAGNQVVGKTFLRGFADLTEALSDPKRNGASFLQRFAGSFVPAGSAAIERAIDPAAEQVFSTIDAIRSRIPGASAFVPKRKNIWGEDIKYFTPDDKSLAAAAGERALSIFNPVYYSAEKKDADVDRWLMHNGFSIDMPQKTQVFDGVRIDLRNYPRAYERLVELRGSGLKLPKYGNQTMKQFFSNLAQEKDPFGRHLGFFMALGNSADDQQNFINGVVRDYTAAAREQVLHDFNAQLGPVIGRERRAALLTNGARASLRQMKAQQQKLQQQQMEQQ
jgi:hypothetical protein